MTNTIEDKGAVDKAHQSLSGKQKLLFGLFCWGVHSWGQAANFKANGYDQKYREARKVMYTGLVIYALGILLFVLFVQ